MFTLIGPVKPVTREEGGGRREVVVMVVVASCPMSSTAFSTIEQPLRQNNTVEAR